MSWEIKKGLEQVHAADLSALIKSQLICSSISRRVLAVPGAIVLYKGLKDEGERKGEGEGEAQGKDIQPPSRGLLRCHTAWMGQTNKIAR